MDPMREALNRRMGKGLQITIIAQPGAEVEVGGEGQEQEEKEREGSDLAPPAKDEDGLESGEMGSTDGNPSPIDPLDSAKAINKPRGSLFNRAEMAQAMKQKKGK